MIKINTSSTLKSIKTALKTYGVGSMLSVGRDSKTVKGEKLGYNTGILYMLPNNYICPASKLAKCKEGCLVSAGKGALSNVSKARQNKTDLYLQNKELFYTALVYEIKRLYKKYGDNLVIRLNGTSDIDHENMPMHIDGLEYNNIFNYFSNIQFYDYTKRAKRLEKALPDNYDLTLSYSGARPSYANQVLKSHLRGARIAVVFDDLKQAVKTGFNGINVLGGDNNDLRHLDPKGAIVGLQAKGKARKDKTGFVVKTSIINIVSI